MSLKLKPKFVPRAEKLEHERLISLINSMADAVIAVDEHIEIVLYNSSALNILDINNIKLNTRLNELFQPVDKNNQPIDIHELIKKAKTPITNRDLRLIYKDGSIINLYISIAPVHLGYSEKGQKGYVLLLRDITREKSLEEERDEFISVVSHELRTPITIAEGNLSNAQLLVKRSGDVKDVKQALVEAYNQVLFLADMINDLSTLSRAERGVLKVEVDSIDVPALIADLVNNYLPEANKKNITIKSVLNPEAKTVNSSRLYVREILQNFLTNAIKYTEKGEVVIHGEKMNKGICVSVHDSGIGISKADQERVFDKFFRSEDFRTREANGTGLGLYVTLKLARLINGEIRMDSELNKGSTFSIYIPDIK